MARGSLQLRHRKACPAKSGKNSGRCKCGPTVYSAIDGTWTLEGYLPTGWRRVDLEPFERRLIEQRERLEAGEPIRSRKVIKLAEYADGWFDGLWNAAEAGRISRLTHNTYVSIWENHLAPEFGGLALAAIDGQMIRSYVTRKLATGLAPVTVNSTITPLSAMLSDAVADGLLQANPARQPRRGRHGGSKRKALYADAKREAPKYLEPVEARALLAATPPLYRDMVLAALSTGFRRGELLGLRWEDIRWADARIDLTGQLQGRKRVGCKCGSEREVVLFTGLAEALGKRRQADGYVFTGPDGLPWGNQAPERAFLRDAYKAAGLDEAGRCWHVLRHTYASVLAAGGVRHDVVAGLMGHQRQGTTSLYSHLFRDALDGVEEALRAAYAPQLEVNQASTDRSVTGVLPQ